MPTAEPHKVKLQMRAAVTALVAVAGCASAKQEGVDASLIDGPKVEIDAPPLIDGPLVDGPTVDASTVDAANQPDAGNVTSDSCGAPVNLTLGALMPGGVTVTSSTAGLADDLRPDYFCTGYEPDGPDAIYVVALEAGQILTASVTPQGWDASIYITSNCIGPPDRPTCLAGADDSANYGAETIMWQATANGFYWVAVDGWTTAAFGSFSLNLQIQ